MAAEAIALNNDQKQAWFSFFSVHGWGSDNSVLLDFK